MGCRWKNDRVMKFENKAGKKFRKGLNDFKENMNKDDTDEG